MFDLILFFGFLLSIEMYIHVYSKATAKHHRATEIRDPSLYFLSFLMYDGRKPKARIADIVKFYIFENDQNSRKARNTVFVCLF